MGTRSNPLKNTLRNLANQIGMHHDGTPEISQMHNHHLALIFLSSESSASSSSRVNQYLSLIKWFLNEIADIPFFGFGVEQ